MKKNFLVAFNHVHSINAWSLVICAVFFLCGCIVGTFASVSAANTDSVKTYLSEFFLATQSEQNVTSGFLMFFWETCKYHFAVVFLGFSILGVVLLPVLSAYQGFVLTFAVSVIVRLYGTAGILPALIVFGVRMLISLPCFFVLASQAFTASGQIMQSTVFSIGQSMKVFGRTYWMRCVVCFLLLALLALFDTYLTRHIVELVSPIV